MTRDKKAELIVSTFKDWVINNTSQEYLGLIAEVDLKARNSWLKEEEKALLEMLGATNIFSPHVTTAFLPEQFRSKEVTLNAVCCGIASFIFEDDGDKESLPILNPEGMLAPVL